MRIRRVPPALALLLAASVAASACGEDPTGRTEPGDVTAVLESPFEDDAAALIEFTGATILDVTAQEGEALVAQTEGAFHVAVVRGPPGEIRLVLHLEDVGITPSARVLQVVDPFNRPRPTDDYTVRIEP